MTRGGGWRMVLPVALMLLCGGLMIFGFLRLRAVERDMRLYDTTNMVWVISQTQVETLKLRAVLAESAGDVGRIGRQYDLFRSRIDMLTQGPQLRFLQGLEDWQPVADTARIVRRYDPLIRQLAPFEETVLSRELAVLNGHLNRAANHAMVGEWQLLSQRIGRYRTAVAQVAYSLAIGLLAALYLGWRIVADRKAQLDAEELRQRSRLLESDLDRERAMVAHWRDFAAVVSHQFRTPLAVIDSAAQRMYRHGAPASDAVLEAKQATIREMVGSLDRLVEAALLLGRLDNAQQQPELSLADLVPPVRSLVTEVRQRYPGREITLLAEAESLTAWCDPKLVQHILMNLIDNAVKYSPADSQVELRLFAQQGELGCVVADRGAGVPYAEVERLFARFERGETLPGEGTGIGLWLAQRLAVLQGGRIEGRHRTGGGTLFTLWLRGRMPEEGQHA